MLPICCDNPNPVVRLCGGKLSAMNAGSGAMTIAVSAASNVMHAVTVGQAWIFADATICEKQG
ncbi:hypothetical protein D3C72_2424340 [compost metagenome]